MNRIHLIWRASFTRRWHMNPDMADISDPVHGHQGRAALLATALFPDEINVLRWLVIHDQGEAAVGDMANPVKQRNPDLKAILDRVEDEEIARMGLPVIDLTDREKLIAHLCDKLDAYLWVHHHRPEKLASAGWRSDFNRIIDMGEALEHDHHIDVTPLVMLMESLHFITKE